ncbi:hypothetical protein OH76DRAFT_1200677 [Lentinus brumalis]|uniref:Uncharacterized protein n=1 Tax=Lentinus brumalis TaxID=2498619 RepID=A0A371CT38_9APHY|nr:hypothetical protein OH76DRAFT_1200677 [Polyporus brumalis]
MPSLVRLQDSGPRTQDPGPRHIGLPLQRALDWALVTGHNASDLPGGKLEARSIGTPAACGCTGRLGHPCFARHLTQSEHSASGPTTIVTQGITCCAFAALGCLQGGQHIHPRGPQSLGTARRRQRQRCSGTRLARLLIRSGFSKGRVESRTQAAG